MGKEDRDNPSAGDIMGIEDDNIPQLNEDDFAHPANEPPLNVSLTKAYKGIDQVLKAAYNNPLLTAEKPSILEADEALNQSLKAAYENPSRDINEEERSEDLDENFTKQ